MLPQYSLDDKTRILWLLGGSNKEIRSLLEVWSTQNEKNKIRKTKEDLCGIQQNFLILIISAIENLYIYK
jgi:hypothetical protein